jgi:hypothetical protein
VGRPGDNAVSFAGIAGICGYHFGQCVRNVSQENVNDVYRGAAEEIPALTRNTRGPVRRREPLSLSFGRAHNEKEYEMSTYWSVSKKIPGRDVFDGRLEEFGIREHIVPGQTTDSYRCLTDGHAYVWVRMDGNGFFWHVRGVSKILYAVADAFETEVVSEYQAKFWGLETEEEWEKWQQEIAIS